MLPASLYALLRQPYTPSHPTAIVATVDADGAPHTAPFGSLRAVGPSTLRFACDRRHSTYANLLRDERVMVCLIAPPDLAVSIFGRARTVKEAMEVMASDAVVEIQVEEVKDDFLPGAEIQTSITLSVPEALLEPMRKYIAEVEGV